MKTTAGKILVVDDEPDLLTLYELVLLREGYQVVATSTVTQAKEALAQESFDLLVTDMRLPDGVGLDLVQYLGHAKRTERAVVITAYGSAENAVQALKAGAFDYLTKPVDLQRFRSVVRDAIHSATPQVSHPLPVLVSAVVGAAGAEPPQTATHALTDKQVAALSQLVGNSDLMVAVRARAKKIAVSMAPVLLQGESGTGKELVARAIHACSHRAGQSFVAVNCGAIPENLLEAEFFGVKKGAYTGAQHDRDGFFQAASGGTLFLDEIGDLPLMMQSKLLRAIQERCIRPIGGVAEVAVDVRIVSASHKHLGSEVTAGRFRQDLYYRLNVIELTLPPLRTRKQDLLQLIPELIGRIAQNTHPGHLPRMSAQALEQLRAYDFPGNVRELENILHRAMALNEGDDIELDGLLLCPSLHSSGSGEASRPYLLGEQEHIPHDLENYLDQHERKILLKVLQETEFNRTAAAQRLGISLRQIRYRMERLHINVPDGRGDVVAGAGGGN